MGVNLSLVLPVWVVSLSLLSWMLYGLDKWKAKRHAWRIPERVLLGLSVLGGAPGALLGMMIFRHKTNHWYFWTVGCLACAGWLSVLLRVITGIN